MYLKDKYLKYAIICLITPDFNNKLNIICGYPEKYGKIKAITPVLKSFLVIDDEGYRQNVGIILSNQDNKVLWARRIGQNAWQFPQGGIREHETPKQALLRELYEEIGLNEEHISIMGCTGRWLRYQLPKRLIRHGSKPLCIGQKQIWYLLRLEQGEHNIRLDHTEHPEFEEWRWVEYWHPLTEVVSFKRDVYECALSELEPLVIDDQSQLG